MNKIKVLVADDHTLVRAGIRSLLENMDWVQVVAEAGDGEEALSLMKTAHPDLLLMDISMKNMNGLAATSKAKKEFPDLRVIILSMYATEDYVRQAFVAGASGYLLKDAAPLELELAIRSVMHGEMYLSPLISKQVVQNYVQAAVPDQGPNGLLTPRQREILRLLAEGNTSKEIAFRLNLSIKTVDAHRKKLMERLEINDVPTLVRYAVRIGLVSP